MDIRSLIEKAPAVVKASLSSPELIAALAKLEKQTGLKLTLPLIAIAVGDQKLDSVVNGLLTDERAREQLKQELNALLLQMGVGATVAKATTFSADDDEEINQIKQQAPAVASSTPNYEAQADAIIASFGYNESDEVMRKRLQTVIVARLRGVRDDLEAIDVLTKSKKIGGLEFTGDQATNLLRLMAGKTPLINSAPGRGGSGTARINKQEQKPIDGKPLPVKPTPPPNLPVSVSNQPMVISGLPVIDEEDGLPVIRMPEMADSKLPMPVAGRGGSRTAHINGSKQPISAPKSVVENLPKQPVSDPKPDPTQLPPAEPQPYPTPLAPVAPNAVAATKPQLDGVKLVSKLVGPVEELAQMTLIDFRRLGSTPEAMVQGIADKIELLSRESFAKRHEAIAAWQRSEVTKFYRLLGQLSLTEGKPIEAVIAERRQAGKPTLTLEEFNELVELHSKLRY